MKFSISRNEFHRALQKVSGVIPSRSTIQILTNVLIYTENNKLYLMGTDLELTMLTFIDADIVEEGGIAIPAKILNDVIRELPEEKLMFEVNDQHRIILKSKHGEYKISGESQNDFPDLPMINTENSIEASAQVLKRMIEKTAFAATSDELRPALTGVLFQLSGEDVRMVATDGHRLSKLKTTSIKYTGENKQIILPTKSLNYLIKNIEDMEGDIHIDFSKNHALFKWGEINIYTKLIIEDYPDYEHALPVNNSKELFVNSQEIIASVKRISLFSSPVTNQIRLSLSNNNLKVSAEDMDMGGAANEELDCNYQFEDLEIGYNATYLLDILRHVDTEDLKMRLESPLHGALVYPVEQKENEEFVMLIMPVRLNDR